MKACRSPFAKQPAAMKSRWLFSTHASHALSTATAARCQRQSTAQLAICSDAHSPPPACPGQCCCLHVSQAPCAGAGGPGGAGGGGDGDAACCLTVKLQTGPRIISRVLGSRASTRQTQELFSGSVPLSSCTLQPGLSAGPTAVSSASERPIDTTCAGPDDEARNMRSRSGAASVVPSGGTGVDGLHSRRPGIQYAPAAPQSADAASGSGSYKAAETELA